MRVLVIDDSADAREWIGEVLQAEGYDCVFAMGGKEALSLLRTATILPDTIMLDMMMPDLDGWQFRKEQMSDWRLRSIPVVVVSGLPIARASMIASGVAGL